MYLHISVAHPTQHIGLALDDSSNIMLLALLNYNVFHITDNLHLEYVNV